LVRATSRRPDDVSLTWLATVRWTVLAAATGALLAGRTGLGVSLSAPAAALVFSVVTASNLWLTWRLRTGRTEGAIRAAGPLVASDALLLMWVLWRSGGVLNPASIFFLVQIVLAALVLGRTWTWIVTALTVTGFGALYFTPSTDLAAAQLMHPEIAVHMSGMWLAFAATAIVIAVLVTALVAAIERRDRDLEELSDRHARSARFASLATLAAGAAHELSTPLATMAVAARELEHSLASRGSSAALVDDARLIRQEVDRCRAILDDLGAGQGGAPADAPRHAAIADVLAAVAGRLDRAAADRVAIDAGAADVRVRWPVHAVSRALVNVVENALHATADGGRVSLTTAPAASGHIAIVVEDTGVGMSPEELARAGEPFFTTRPAGRGTGLGLFVARSTVEQLGGTLTVVSAPRQGATVTLSLPIDVVGDTPAHE
jgi:two-component system sensor histidine kinase RegB